MVQLLRLLCGALIGVFQSSARREAEIVVLRQQINVLRRKSPKRPALNNSDRLLFVWLSRLVPTTLAALAVISPETVIRWHRAGFRAYWRSRLRCQTPESVLPSRHHAQRPDNGVPCRVRCGHRLRSTRPDLGVFLSPLARPRAAADRIAQRPPGLYTERP
jgi:hypothetical protein